MTALCSPACRNPSCSASFCVAVTSPGCVGSATVQLIFHSRASQAGPAAPAQAAALLVPWLCSSQRVLAVFHPILLTGIQPVLINFSFWCVRVAELSDVMVGNNF